MQKTISPELSHKLANMGFVCACLVVLLHVPFDASPGTWDWRWFQFLKQGLYRTAVPFFFTAAGYFLAGHMGERGWWLEAVCKRMRTLVVPYIIWTLIAVVHAVSSALVANLLAGAPLMRNLPAGWETWLKFIGVLPHEFPLLGQLWFVRSLFVFVSLSPLVVVFGGLRSRWVGIALPVALWVLGIIYNFSWASETWRMIWIVTFSLTGAAFFSLGIHLRQWRYSFKCRRVTTLLLAVLAVGLSGCGVLGLEHGATWWDYICSLGYTITLFVVWKLAPSRPWPRWLTGSAFSIYLMHTFPIWALTKLGENSEPARYLATTIWGYFGFGLCTIAMCLLVTCLLKRYLPRFSAVIFGGR